MKTILSNPPYSVPWSAENDFLKDVRFAEYGKLAPKSKADFAFIQDMIYHLSADGIMSVVLPHGVLFRGSGEGIIRRYIVESKNVLDAIIGLPANLFFGTSISTCILIFKKNRTKNDKVLFIDASDEFQKKGNVNVLTDEHLSKIHNTYINRLELPKYSCLVGLDEIADNDYNLNIPRYIDKFQEDEPIDLELIMISLDNLYDERKKLDVEIDKYFIELGLKSAPVTKNKKVKNQNFQQKTLFDYDH